MNTIPELVESEGDLTQEILHQLADHDMPWNAPDQVFLYTDRGEAPVPTVRVVLLNRGGGAVDIIDAVELFPFPADPAPEPIVAVVLVQHGFAGQRDERTVVSGGDLDIGDRPDDIEVRVATGVFAGGGYRMSMHIRNTNKIGELPGAFSTEDAAQRAALEKVLTYLNQGRPTE